MLRAWLLEATADYLVLLAPVSRDGVQRGGEGPHAAVHFVGHDGEVVSHHLACSPTTVMVQRYDGYMLFAKDAEEHAAGDLDACLDDDWHPSYPQVAAWLLSADDVAMPPLPVHLPDVSRGWAGRGSAWSVVLARGQLEELAEHHHLRHDTAPRLYLLEIGPAVRLWASRRVDEAFDTLYQRHGLDGLQLLRHSLSFSPLDQSQLGVQAIGGENAGGAWLLWSPELRHTGQVASGAGPGGGKLTFWRCAVGFAGEPADLRARRRCAYLSAAEATPEISPVEVLPVGRKAWEGHPNLWEAHPWPREDARALCVVSGLPCYPALRRQEGTLDRPEDWWVHPSGRDASLHLPVALLR
uniref:Uncharacterized protein n=1 Tax=Alexandrium catenella TaxID=2925 RepID=A0A7S1WD05_ALECA